jgi:hypothetical protein
VNAQQLEKGWSMYRREISEPRNPSGSSGEEARFVVGISLIAGHSSKFHFYEHPRF